MNFGSEEISEMNRIGGSDYSIRLPRLAAQSSSSWYSAPQVPRALSQARSQLSGLPLCTSSTRGHRYTFRVLHMGMYWALSPAVATFTTGERDHLLVLPGIDPVVKLLDTEVFRSCTQGRYWLASPLPASILDSSLEARYFSTPMSVLCS